MSWRPRSRRLAILGLFAFLVLISLEGAAQVRKRLDPEKPQPDVADLRYGPFARNALDLWKAPQPARSFWIRVPSWSSSTVEALSAATRRRVPAWLVDRCLAEGISVASASYRLSTEAPFPAPMLDGARAIQFLRLKAAGSGNRPQQDRGLRQLGRCGNRALGRVPRRPGRSWE